MKQTEKRLTAKQLEENLRYMIVEMEQYHFINPDGSLDEGFLLHSIIQSNPKAALEHKRLTDAYNKLRKCDAFIKVFNSRKVSDKTLKSIMLSSEYLVRPYKSNDTSFNRSIYFGEILKLPALLDNNYADGEEWKGLVEKGIEYSIGDKVLYSFKSNILLDNELLHVVGCFCGKVLTKHK